jgi:hypothetical protein
MENYYNIYLKLIRLFLFYIYEVLIYRKQPFFFLLYSCYNILIVIGNFRSCDRSRVVVVSYGVAGGNFYL